MKESEKQSEAKEEKEWRGRGRSKCSMKKTKRINKGPADEQIISSLKKGLKPEKNIVRLNNRRNEFQCEE